MGFVNGHVVLRLHAPKVPRIVATLAEACAEDQILGMPVVVSHCSVMRTVCGDPRGDHDGDQTQQETDEN